MNITVERQTLLAAVKSVAGAAAKENAENLILAGILFEADLDSQSLWLTATNGQVALKRRIKNLRVEDGGNAVIKGSLLRDMLALFSGETVTVERKVNGVRLSSGEAEYFLPLIQAEKFPRPEIPFPQNTVKVTGLNRLIRRTSFAAGNEKQALSLQGIQLSLAAETTTATATDTFRLVVPSPRTARTARWKPCCTRLRSKPFAMRSSLTKPCSPGSPKKVWC